MKNCSTLQSPADKVIGKKRQIASLEDHHTVSFFFNEQHIWALFFPNILFGKFLQIKKVKKKETWELNIIIVTITNAKCSQLLNLLPRYFSQCHSWCPGICLQFQIVYYVLFLVFIWGVKLKNLMSIVSLFPIVPNTFSSTFMMTFNMS